MKKVFLLLAFAVLSATGAKAATAQAIWCAGNSTLYFANNATTVAANGTWDGQTITKVWNTTKVTSTSATADPDWVATAKATCTRVVFDASFADVLPVRTALWFDGFALLDSVHGLQYLNTTNVTDMNKMFYGCVALRNLDLSGRNVSKVTTFANMFNGCAALKSINFDGWVENATAPTITTMFNGCDNFTSVTIQERAAPTIYYTLPQSTNVPWTQAVWSAGDKSLNFYKTTHHYVAGESLGAGTVTTIWTGPKVYNTGTAAPAWQATVKANCVKVFVDESFKTERVLSCFQWFKDLAKVTKIDGLRYLNTSEVTNMQGMFQNLALLERSEVNTEALETSNVTNMSYMFSGCSKLDPAVQGYNTSKVENFAYMFNGCKEIYQAEVSDFDISAATNLNYMFNGCSNLQELDLLTWKENTTTPPTVASIFAGMTALRRVGVSLATAPTIWNSITGTTIGKSGPQVLWVPEYTTLYFLDTTDSMPFGKNDYYNGYEITAVWSGTAVTNTPVSGDGRAGWVGTAKATCDLVVIDPSFQEVRPASCFSWFRDFAKLIDVNGLDYLNLSECTTLDAMFYNCPKLESIQGVEDLNLGSVTNINSMFRACPSLPYLDLSAWDTKNITMMAYTFAGNTKMESIELFPNISASTRVDNMFNGCTALETIDLSAWTETAALTNVADIFKTTTALRHIIIDAEKCPKIYAAASNGTAVGKSGPQVVWTPDNATLYFIYTTTDVVGKGDMFRGAEVTHVWNGTAVTNTPTSGETYPGWVGNKNTKSAMATNCVKAVFDSTFVNVTPASCWTWLYRFTALTDVQGFKYLKATDLAYFISGSTALTKLDLSGADVSKVTRLSNMFKNCTNLVDLDLTGWEKSTAPEMTTPFAGTGKLRHVILDEDKFLSLYRIIPYTSGKSGPQVVWTEGNATLTFLNTGRDVVGTGDTFNGQTVTNVWSGEIVRKGPIVSFSDSEDYLKYNWNYYAKLNSKGEVTDYPSYGYAAKVKNIVFLPSFAEVKPTSFYQYFKDFTALTTVTGAENVTTDNVTTMYGMFYNCPLLTSLDINSWNTENVTTMASMFYGNSSLENIDLSRWNTAKVTTMGSMFYGNSSLKTANIRNFTNTALKTTSSMFYGCPELTTIWCPNSLAASTQSSVFTGDVKLVGAVPYTSKSVTGAMANPVNGYFTDRRESIELEYGEPYSVRPRVMVDEVTYTRGYPEGAWQGWFTPFETPTESLDEAGLTAAYINSVHQYDDTGDGVIDRTELEVVRVVRGKLHAATPYLVKSATDAYVDVKVPNATLLADSILNNIHVESATAAYDFYGYYMDTYSTGDKWSVTNAGTLDRRANDAGTDVTLYPMNWYMTITPKPGSPYVAYDDPAATRPILIREVGEVVDGIVSLYPESEQRVSEFRQGTFDLQGRQLSTPQKGINIINGKKVYVK